MSQQTSGISMRPDGVKQVGRRLRAKATDAKQYVAQQFANSEAAANANARWLSANALRNCRNAWRSQLDTLLDQTRLFGDNLAVAAATVDADDKDAHDAYIRSLPA